MWGGQRGGGARAVVHGIGCARAEELRTELVATTARLMKKAKSRAIADSMRAYQIAACTFEGLWRLTLRERTRPLCR